MCNILVFSLNSLLQEYFIVGKEKDILKQSWSSCNYLISYKYSKNIMMKKTSKSTSRVSIKCETQIKRI